MKTKEKKKNIELRERRQREKRSWDFITSEKRLGFPSSTRVSAAFNNWAITICRRSHPAILNPTVCDQVVKIFTVKLNSFCAIEFSASTICNRTRKKANRMSAEATKFNKSSSELATNVFRAILKGWNSESSWDSLETLILQSSLTLHNLRGAKALGRKDI